MPEWMAHLLTNIMVWCGSKLFPVVVVAPDETKEYVIAIAFSKTEDIELVLTEKENRK